MSRCQFPIADESLVLFINNSLRLFCIDSPIVWLTFLQTQTQGRLYVVNSVTSLPVVVTNCDIIVVDWGVADVCEQSALLEGDLHPGISRYVLHLAMKQPVLLIEYPLQSGSLSHSALQKVLPPVKLL